MGLGQVENIVKYILGFYSTDNQFDVLVDIKVSFTFPDIHLTQLIMLSSRQFPEVIDPPISERESFQVVTS